MTIQVTTAPVTHRRVLSIALPIALSNAAVPLLGAVDTAVMGRLGTVEVGAVGLGAIILAFLLGVFNFLRMSTTGLVAQATGAGDHDEASAHLLRAMLLGLGIGLALLLAQMPLFYVSLGLAPTSPEVEATARTYLGIRIWGVPATIALFVLNGWLIAVERARAVLFLQLVMNALNAGLNILFVLGFGWGVAGVAVGTLIAEAVGLAIGLWFARHALRRAWVVSRNLVGLFTPEKVARLARINGDIMLRSIFLQLSYVSFVYLGAYEGDLYLAANQVLLQLTEITVYALDGLAFAAESLVGQAVGARVVRDVRRSSMLVIQWGLVGAVMVALVFAFAGGAIIDVLTTLPELRLAAREFLPWIVVFPVIGILPWLFDGIFIGATLTREVLWAMVISTLGYAVCVMIALPLIGNHGLWLSLLVLNVMRGVLMARWYPRAEAAAMA